MRFMLLIEPLFLSLFRKFTFFFEFEIGFVFSVLGTRKKVQAQARKKDCVIVGLDYLSY